MVLDFSLNSGGLYPYCLSLVRWGPLPHKSSHPYLRGNNHLPSGPALVLVLVLVHASSLPDPV